MHRSRLRSILSATAMMVVVAAALTSAVLLTRAGPQPQRSSQGTSASAAVSSSASPAASPITPTFSRSAAEAAARLGSSGIVREESKLTTLEFADAYANAEAMGGPTPLALVPSIEAQQSVAPLRTPLPLPGKPSEPSTPVPTQLVWLVAVSGSSICCGEFPPEGPSRWAVLTYNATTGAIMSALYGPPLGSGSPSSSQTWPAGFDSIQDLAS